MPAAGAGSDLVEVVVTLPQPPLARAVRRDRQLAARTHAGHSLNVRAPAAVSYLRTLAAPRGARGAYRRRSPARTCSWHYGVALDGVAVVVPRSSSPAGRVPGATVWPTVTYHALRDGAGGAALNRTPAADRRDRPLGRRPRHRGPGHEDRDHRRRHRPDPPLLQPGRLLVSARLSAREHELHDAEGDRRPRFPSPSTTWKYAALPFDPQYSEHATHVAGIAAGDYDTLATGPRGHVLVSGIAPKAYLGNYKALTVPTQDYGLDGNSPEIAKAIDQAVADGMNVINLSLGEPEIAPDRDIVVQALDNAAAAGVVPVVAAGNDYDEAGHGSIGSPGNAPDAISVAASSEGGGSRRPTRSRRSPPAGRPPSLSS